jgi:hypothetical protein
MMNTSELKQLGDLLHAHRWRSGGEWADAIGRLARLSDADVVTMVRLSVTSDEAAAAAASSPAARADAGTRTAVPPRPKPAPR